MAEPQTAQAGDDWDPGAKDAAPANDAPALDPNDPAAWGEAGMATAALGAERVLNQDEIDSLLGFANGDDASGERTGVRALINSALVSYERLPMLEVVFADV